MIIDEREGQSVSIPLHMSEELGIDVRVMRGEGR